MLSSKPNGTASVLGKLRQAGSMKALFPRNCGTDLQGVLVNTAGGVTGGDRFTLKATAEPTTHLTLTTQTAERAYRAQPGEIGRITNHLTIDNEARLNWLPQETILFQGCALKRHLNIDMARSAQLLMCETLVFGRAAMGEVITSGLLFDRIKVQRNGRRLFLDAMTLKGDIAAHLARPNIANGAGAIASMLYVAPDAETHLDPIRDALSDSAGVSLIHPDVLFLRALATDSFSLRKTLIPILSRLNGAPLPRPWMI